VCSSDLLSVFYYNQSGEKINGCRIATPLIQFFFRSRKGKKGAER